MVTYTTSKYLRVARTGDQYFEHFGGDLSTFEGGNTILYHSLFGRGRYVNSDTIELLRQCTQSHSMEGLRQHAPDEVIRELISLSFLVPDDRDERTSITALLERREDMVKTGELVGALQLILTNSCNFGCEYCFAYTFESALDSRAEAGEKIKPKKVHQEATRAASAKKLLPVISDAATDGGHGCGSHGDEQKAAQRNPAIKMDFATASEAITKAVQGRAKMGGKHLAVSLFGGEPTLNRDLILQLLPAFSGKGPSGVEVSFDITTNGSRLDPELVAAFARHRVETTVSVDYINEELGTYRGKDKQPVSWPTIRAGILDLVRAGVPTNITTVLSEQTWDHWNHNLIDFCAEAGIPELDVIVSFQDQFFSVHSPRAVAHRLLEAFDYGLSKGVALKGYWFSTYQLIVDEEKFKSQADYKTCPAVGRQLSIEPNGSVYSCKVTNTQLGKIADWDNIFQSEGYKRYAMRAYSNSPECTGCELEGTCSGGSAGSLEENHGSIMKMSPGYCEYIRAVVNGLLERHVQIVGARQQARPARRVEPPAAAMSI